jgi:hypothetical protein
MTENKIIFLHLHKCGGTAYLSYLNSQGLSYDRETNGNLHPKEWFYTPNQIPYDIISYEFSSPPYEHLKDLYDISTLCIFRHPVDRLWSNYCYDTKYKYVPEMTFKEYCLSVNTAYNGLYTLPNMYQRYFGGSIELAKERIKRIDKILIFEEDLTEVPIINRTPDKPQIPIDDYNFALELNRADIELYNYAKFCSGCQKHI